MEHLDIVAQYLREPGIEIGAFTTPVPGIKPIYLDRFAEYAGIATLNDYIGDACDLPFYDSSLRYVVTSHVLEHVANPLAALSEWYRVLMHGGIIYAVIPDRRKTFDRNRALTTVDHIYEDFKKEVGQSDGTHIDDFVFSVDWKEFSPATHESGIEKAKSDLASTYHRSVESGLEINIHFHVFESHVVRDMIGLGNARRIWPGRIDLLRTEENFPSSNPNGFLIVARVCKPALHRVTSILKRRGLRSDARKFH